MQIIHIQPQAPIKPKLGEACNGCGVCCLIEPCPLGIIFFAKRQGECPALHWATDHSSYRCGFITQPNEVLKKRLPRIFHWLVPLLAWALGRWAKRWIAAGIGCDCNATPDYAPPKI